MRYKDAEMDIPNFKEGMTSSLKFKIYLHSLVIIYYYTYRKGVTAMKCPVCGTVDLLMSERSGVEIDYCPQCRGVWLDRGELDKIIERSLPSAQPVHQNYERAEKSHHQTYSHDKSYSNQGHYKKKESFLGELFDF